MKALFDSDRSDALQQLEACLEQLRRHARDSGRRWTCQSELTVNGGVVLIQFDALPEAEPAAPAEPDSAPETIAVSAPDRYQVDEPLETVGPDVPADKPTTEKLTE